MAKMFYSIEEAAQRLGKSVEAVQKMASSGQLQEFRDRDKLMFKREQVDLLAGDAGEVSISSNDKSGAGMGGSSLTLALEDEPEGSGAPAGKSRAGAGGSKAGSGSGMGIEADEPVGQRSGISIFDTEDTDTTDPLAATAITPTGRRGAPAPDAAEMTAMDSGGSGSGLLDLTREADDTSLGADLLEDVHRNEDEAGGSGAGIGVGSETQGASGLFETTSAPSDISAAAAAPAMMMMAAEPYDGVWSGLAGGLALGVIVACIATMFAVMSGMLGAGETDIVSLITTNLWAFVGGFGALMIIGAGVGFVLGRKS